MKKMKRILKWQVFFAFVLFVTVLWGSDKFTVFANDVVYISKPEDMRALYNTNPNTSYMLLNDIDMKNFGFWESPDFNGKEFSGNGFAIRNLISRKNGLFQSIPAGCHIHDVGIIGMKVNANYNYEALGGIVGSISETTFLSTKPITIIERCCVDDSTYFDIQSFNYDLSDNEMLVEYELPREIRFGSIIGTAFAGKYGVKVNNINFEIDSKVFIKDCVGLSGYNNNSSFGGIVGCSDCYRNDYKKQNSIFIENCIGSSGIAELARYTRIDNCIAIGTTRSRRKGFVGEIDNNTFIANSYYQEEPAFTGGDGVTFPTLYKIDGNTDFSSVMGDRWLDKVTYGGLPIPNTFLKYFKLTEPIYFYPDASLNNTYLQGTEISLSHDFYGATIHYTTDGTEPTLKSAVYEKPILLTRNMTVKAILAFKDMIPSDVYASSYVVEIPKKETIQSDVYESSYVAEIPKKETIQNNPISTESKKKNSKKKLNYAKLYRNYIKKTGVQTENHYLDYYLIHLNKDSIPEMVLTNGFTGAGSTILYIYKGKVKAAKLNGFFYGYIKGKSKVKTGYSLHGNILTFYYQIKGRNVKEILSLTDGSSEPVDSPNYGFVINDKSVSEKVFRKKEKQMKKEDKKYNGKLIEIKNPSKFGLK